MYHIIYLFKIIIFILKMDSERTTELTDTIEDTQDHINVIVDDDELHPDTYVADDDFGESKISLNDYERKKKVSRQAMDVSKEVIYQ